MYSAACGQRLGTRVGVSRQQRLCIAPPGRRHALSRGLGQAFRASATDDASEAIAHIKFKLTHMVPYGYDVRIVGEGPALGQWQVDHAKPMTWNDGHVWTAECQLPVSSTLVYKYVTCRFNELSVWCPNENHIVNLPDTANATVEIVDTWDAPQGQVTIEAPPPPPPPPAAAAAAAEGEQQGEEQVDRPAEASAHDAHAATAEQDGADVTAGQDVPVEAAEGGQGGGDVVTAGQDRGDAWPAGQDVLAGAASVEAAHEHGGGAAAPGQDLVLPDAPKQHEGEGSGAPHLHAQASAAPPPRGAPSSKGTMTTDPEKSVSAADPAFESSLSQAAKQLPVAAGAAAGVDKVADKTVGGGAVQVDDVGGNGAGGAFAAKGSGAAGIDKTDGNGVVRGKGGVGGKGGVTDGNGVVGNKGASRQARDADVAVSAAAPPSPRRPPPAAPPSPRASAPPQARAARSPERSDVPPQRVPLVSALEKTLQKVVPQRGAAPPTLDKATAPKGSKAKKGPAAATKQAGLLSGGGVEAPPQSPGVKDTKSPAAATKQAGHLSGGGVEAPPQSPGVKDTKGPAAATKQAGHLSGGGVEAPPQSPGVKDTKGPAAATKQAGLWSRGGVEAPPPSPGMKDTKGPAAATKQAGHWSGGAVETPPQSPGVKDTKGPAAATKQAGHLSGGGDEAPPQSLGMKDAASEVPQDQRRPQKRNWRALLDGDDALAVRSDVASKQQPPPQRSAGAGDSSTSEPHKHGGWSRKHDDEEAAHPDGKKSPPQQFPGAGDAAAKQQSPGKGTTAPKRTSDSNVTLQAGHGVGGAAAWPPSPPPGSTSSGAPAKKQPTGAKTGMGSKPPSTIGMVLEDMTNKQLQDLLAERNLAKTGKKEVLIKRLRDAERQ